MSFTEETQADRRGCGENGLHGDQEQSFHTRLGFSQDQFSSNQLLWRFCISLHLTSNKFLDLTLSDMTERHIDYGVVKITR